MSRKGRMGLVVPLSIPVVSNPQLPPLHPCLPCAPHREAEPRTGSSARPRPARTKWTAAGRVSFPEAKVLPQAHYPKVQTNISNPIIPAEMGGKTDNV